VSDLRRGVRALLTTAMLAAAGCKGQHGVGSSRAGPPGAEGEPSSARGGVGGMGGMGRMMSGPMPMMGGGAHADTAAAPKPAALPAPAAAACPATGQALVDQGRRIFGGAGNCFACHSAAATGTQVAPNLTDATWLDIDGSYGAIVALIRSGVPHPRRYPAPMPPMGGAQLTGEEVCAVAAYVYSLRGR
jgi:mono/diheme cytochrome c family protein